MTLDELFIKFGSDKSSQHHNYSPTYEKIFASFKDKNIMLLELGIGGYHYEDRGGGCLKAFEQYFSKASIVGLDIYEKVFLDSDRIATYICSQDDESNLNFLIEEVMGKPDIVIDDASHINSKTIKSFEILFPRLEQGGIYIIEDVETSYWNEIASDGTDFQGGTHPDTIMNYMKELCDIVNYEHCNGRVKFRQVHLKFGDMIKSISFHSGLIVIEKK